MADYNINAVTRRVVYDGSSGTGPYAFSFELLAETDIVVYFNATKLTLASDYSVDISDVTGTGDVTIIVDENGNVTETPDANDQIVLVGSRDLERVTDFVTAGALRASALNEQLDSLVIFDQQLAEESKRTMRAPVYDPALVEDGGTVNMELPTASSRAGKTLAFDTNGNPVVGEDIGNWRGDWAADVAYTVRDLVKDGSNSNVYRVNTAHTSSGTTPISSNADAAKFDLVVDAASAGASATAAAASATAAAASETAAGNSATAAAASATTATTQASTATTKASEASTSATNAATSATAASTAQTAAETAQAAAETAETNAETAQTAAETAKTAAETAQTAAETAETNAATSETNAATSASTATTKASEAATSATNAATSETNAATSEANASTSATAAAASQVAAASSAAAAANTFDSFDDTYLGSKASDPTVDNDGDALTTGDLYFNTADNEMRVYDGANWIAASSAGGASLLNYNYTATAGQTTFSGADDNSATLSYTTSNIIVTLNGVTLEDGTDYTATDGTSVVLTDGAVVDDELNIIAFKSFTTADMVSATTGGTFNGNVTVNADATVTGDLTVDTDTLHVDSTNNRVGVGTTSPDEILHLESDDCRIKMVDTDDTAGDFGEIRYLNSRFIFSADDGDVASSSSIEFQVDNTERMRIDSSGNLLVGKTSPSTTSLGVEARPDGTFAAVKSGGGAAVFGRDTNNGTIVQCRKDGSNVGAIGTATNQAGQFYIAGASTGLQLRSSDVLPTSSSGSFIDNSKDLGDQGARWDDVYATNGTIQTSDQNEKQQIAALTTAEVATAKRISALFKTFKWNDAVTDKGSNARTHAGVIAQDVQAAFTAEGLDASDYALFISATWWEADEAYTDDDGNAQTETNIYETQAEAPAGATERTRLGIRYPELLAFVGAATEQRLADIESRLTALEASD